MKILPFKSKHIQQAAQLAELNFKEENKNLNNILPNEHVPDLSGFADNNLGITAFEGDTMLGFIGCYGPCRNHFGKVDGIWSPVHANGAIHKDRQKIYSMMYQYASDVWVQKAMLSHAITVYAPNTSAINALFDNGFGKRCVDGILNTNKFSYKLQDTDTFIELPKSKFGMVHRLSNLTKEHLQKPPAFMPRRSETLHEFQENITNDVRIFIAKKENEIIAYLKIENEAETFIGNNKNMMNITGAYLLDKYRGRKIYSNLLNYTIDILKSEKYTHLGVDYESINPTANNFWQKHFVPYTYSLARRIDERILE